MDLNINNIISWFLLFLSFLLARSLTVNKIIHVLLNILCIFIITGLIFLLLEADFLAFMFLIIYAGAIVILFVCCFMLMSFKNLKSYNSQPNMIMFISFCLMFYLYIDFSNLYIISILPHSNYIISNYVIQSSLVDFFLYHKSMNAIEFSTLTQLGIILYNEAWFETLFLGLLILLAITYIVYLFKK